MAKQPEELAEAARQMADHLRIWASIKNKDFYWARIEKPHRILGPAQQIAEESSSDKLKRIANEVEKALDMPHVEGKKKLRQLADRAQNGR